MSEGIIIALIGIMGAAVAARMTIHAERKKTEAEAGKSQADATQIITTTALDLIAPLRAEVEKISQENCSLEGKLAGMEAEIIRLRRQVNAKDQRIQQLEALVKDRDAEIAELRSRVDELEKGARHE